MSQSYRMGDTPIQAFGSDLEEPMANPYYEIYKHNGYGDERTHYAVPPELVDDPTNVPGRQILAEAAGLALGGGVTFNHLFQAFNATTLRGNWTWNGSGGGWSCHELLDGTKTTGECKHFAEALWFLARCPAPWGLGLPKNQVERSTSYEGVNGEGFVSIHNGNFLKLASNVLSAPGYGGQPLYYWANHKTVKFNNTYHDVCYQTTYNAESDMAEFDLTGSYALTEKEGLWDQTDHDTLHLQIEGKIAERATRRNYNFYFRPLSQPEQLANNAGYEGPISETQLEMRRIGARGLNVLNS